MNEVSPPKTTAFNPTPCSSLIGRLNSTLRANAFDISERLAHGEWTGTFLAIFS